MLISLCMLISCSGRNLQAIHLKKIFPCMKLCISMATVLLMDECCKHNTLHFKMYI